ncbi:MAG: universal stress protein [Vitreoscilla sp.]|nr:universal stress protein [Vitreoscilla sp.]
MFKRTLIVLAPGLQPDAVIQAGVAMARACLAEVVFYTGLTPTRPPAAGSPDREMVAQWGSLDDKRVRSERLHRQAQEVAESLGVLSRSVIATADDAASGILGAARTSHCDVIVVACDGGNAVVRLLNGSVIPGLVTASPVPVMVCTPRPTAGGAHGAAMRHLLVILEDSDLAGVARTQGLDLARELAADLLFVHIRASAVLPVMEAVGFVGGPDDRLAAEIQMQSQRLLASASATATRAGLTARGMSLPAGTSAKDITRMALDQACELIVVAHRGSNAVMRLLTGSLIPGLITAAATPVLICREPEHPPPRSTPRRRHHRHRAASAAVAARAAYGH